MLANSRPDYNSQKMQVNETYLEIKEINLTSEIP